MNDLRPRINEKDGLWYFTIRTDDEARPIGLCITCSGHYTSLEAEQHYYEFQVKSAVYNKFQTEHHIMNRCVFPDCLEFTRKLIKPGGRTIEMFPLCTRHSNEKGLRKIWPFQPKFQELTV